MTSTRRELLQRPILIVSPPRSGSTLLFETLEHAPSLYSTGKESHRLIESIAGLAPADRGWSSNRLTAADATPQIAEQLSAAFYGYVTDRGGEHAWGAVRMLEKTPKNALRVPFFDAIWSDAEFVYLYRDPRETLYSMMEAWHSGYFRTYPGLPGWLGKPWSLLLVPGWERLKGLELPQVVAHQWAITMDTLVSDLEALPAERVHALDFRDFLGAPQEVVSDLTKAVGLGWDQHLTGELARSKTTLSPPQKDKWRGLAGVIEQVWPIVEAADARARRLLEQRRIRPAE